MNRTIIYGEGGYDPSKPDNNVLESFESPDVQPEEILDTQVAITPAAITQLQNTLADPATNSIAKIKSALTEFLEQLRG